MQQQHNVDAGSGALTFFDATDDATGVLDQYGADLDARTPKDWTPLSYAKAKGKYGVTHEKGIYPEDVLKARRAAPSRCCFCCLPFSLAR